MRGVFALVLLFPAVALAGCLDGSIEGVRIVVTDEPGGPPLAGVTVLGAKRTWGADFRETAVTDERGEVSMRAPVGATFSVEHPGFVRESTAARDGMVALALYREKLTVEIDGVLSGADADTGGSDRPVPVRWDPHAVRFGRSPDAHRGYVERALRADLTLAWNNTPFAIGDLGIGAGPDASEPFVVEDGAARQTELGPHEERARMERGKLGDVASDDFNIFAGAATGKALLAPGDLSYHLRIDATFGVVDEAPNAATGAIAALLVAALILRRRARV